MTRTVAEIDAELAALRAKGQHPRSGPMRALRAERAEAGGAGSGNGAATAKPKNRPIVSSPAPTGASDDVEFVNQALAQMLLRGNGAGKVEKSYSDIRGLLRVKHILEDAAGLRPTGRMTIPPWETLGRERDTGNPFRPGETQAVVDGLVQRGVPVRAAPSAKPSITKADGSPLPLRRSTLDEPEGTAQFVTADIAAD